MQKLSDEFNVIVDTLNLDEEKTKILKGRESNYTEHNLLDLSDLALQSLPEDIFEGIESILHLNLSNNQIEYLPDTLFQSLYQLLSLDLSYCLSPSSLNEDEPLTLEENLFSSLINLLLLDLSGNQLEFLPDGLFNKLFNLEAINLSYNMLALLPMSIGNCINLEELYISSNFLPIEFKEVYSNYLDVQDFIAPFSAAWNVIDNPLDGINEISFDDSSHELEDNEIKSQMSDLLKDMFNSDEN